MVTSHCSCLTPHWDRSVLFPLGAGERSTFPINLCAQLCLRIWWSLSRRVFSHSVRGMPKMTSINFRDSETLGQKLFLKNDVTRHLTSGDFIQGNCIMCKDSKPSWMKASDYENEIPASNRLTLQNAVPSSWGRASSEREADCRLALELPGCGSALWSRHSSIPLVLWTQWLNLVYVANSARAVISHGGKKWGKNMHIFSFK